MDGTLLSFTFFFSYSKLVLGECEEQVLASSQVCLFFYLEKRKRLGRYSKEDILKWHSSCHGSTEDSASSCQDLCKGGWFLSAGLQLPWLVSFWPAGWYQGTSTLISNYRTPPEPNDPELPSLHYKVAKLPESGFGRNPPGWEVWIWEHSTPILQELIHIDWSPK